MEKLLSAFDLIYAELSTWIFTMFCYVVVIILIIVLVIK